MASGTVKWFNEGKGFGFITNPEGGKDVFLHSSELKKSGIPTVKEGDSLTYEIAPGDKGPKAVSVAVVSGEGSAPVAA